MMEAASPSGDAPINGDAPNESWKSSESELKKFDEDGCQESNNISDEVCIMRKNSYNKLSFKNENALAHVLEGINDACKEALFDGSDENLQLLLCTQNCINAVIEIKNDQSPEIVVDPFDLLTEQEQSKEKYQPIRRKLPHTRDKLNVALCCSSSDSNQPELLKSVSSAKDVIENKTNKSYTKNVDPFDLLAEEEVPQESYESVKRNVSQGNRKRTFKTDSVAGVDAEAYLHDEMHEVNAPQVVQHSIPETKRQRTACRVAYIHSQQLLEKTNELIRIEGRAQLVHSLISAFGLVRYLELTTPRFATDVEILGFHCPDYIAFLRDISVSGDSDDNYNEACKEAENYGLSYDCPIQKGIYETCCLISGATIVAAEQLVNNTADIAINWYGGWHHAKRDSASGFCYINDIVLGVLKLREKFDRILYVDIDLHHGDGVEEAFSMTPKVMTVSFHKYASGFFPGSGSVEDIGTGKGRFYSVNAPLLDGIRDAEFFAVFCRVMQLVREKFQPQVVVMQCGADSLSSDPMASFNLTHFGIAKCVGFIMSWSLPTLLLGGGGYNFPNTSKCWTFLTALAAGKKLPLDIPEHEHLLSYGPDFEMSTTAGNRKDCNTKEYLAILVEQISRNLSNIKGT